MQRIETSLPFEVDRPIRDGTRLVGDDFAEQQLALWFSQEQEAFHSTDAGNSEEDPWYAYMRYVNEVLGFSAIRGKTNSPNAMLVLGPGSGTEVQQFAQTHPGCKLSFLEASRSFQALLRERFPSSNIVEPKFTGEIALADQTQDIVCALSVLHHIPNVSKVLREISRVTRKGGFLILREPCSSMGDWRYPRSATPNERGISQYLLVRIAEHAGFVLQNQPVPVLLEPINKFLKKTIGFKRISFRALYRVDRVLSLLVSVNDHYWRDSWFKKIGPSSYFYLFRKKVNP
jgi:SAM-dependent methyltransferase